MKCQLLNPDWESHPYKGCWRWQVIIAASPHFLITKLRKTQFNFRQLVESHDILQSLCLKVRRPGRSMGVESRAGGLPDYRSTCLLGSGIPCPANLRIPILWAVRKCSFGMRLFGTSDPLIAFKAGSPETGSPPRCRANADTLPLEAFASLAFRPGALPHDLSFGARADEIHGGVLDGV